MNDLEKLKTLLPHWLEHNREHAATYREWADKARALDRKDLAGIIDRLCLEAEEMSRLFEEAVKEIG